MAYTPPAYNAVNFKPKASGYTPPAYNAVNFKLLPDTPTANIQGRTTIAFAALALAQSQTTIAGSTTTALASGATKQSVFSVITASDFVPVQYNPRGIIESSTTISFVLGAVTPSDATITGATTIDFERYYDTPIVGITNFTPLGGGITSDRFQSVNKTGGTFRAIYEAPSRFTLRGKGTCSFASRNNATATFAANASANTSFSGSALHPSEATATGSATLIPSGRTLLLSSFFSVGQASANYSGAPATPGVFSINGVSAASFGGTYSSVTVASVPFDADALYVTSRSKQVFANGI